MSEFRSQCGCEIHVAQWTSKRKIASVQQCPMHKSAEEMCRTLEACVNALRSYQHGNVATDLAMEMADKAEVVVATARIK